MALNKDWREFLELLNSRGVDYVIFGAEPGFPWAPALHRGRGDFRAAHTRERATACGSSETVRVRTLRLQGN